MTTFACPRWTLAEIARNAPTLGYDGVEFRCDAHHSHGVEVYAEADERQMIRKVMEKAGVGIACLATSVQLSESSRRELLMPRLQLASDVGASFVRVFAGPRPPQMEHNQFIAMLSDNLRGAAVEAEQLNVKVLLQTHDGTIRAADAAAAVRKAEHPRLGILYDTAQPLRAGESIEETMANLSGLVSHVHFHDAMNRPDALVITRIGKGEMLLDDVLRALVNIGYDGFLCGEWFGLEYGDEPAEALEKYRKEARDLAERLGIKLA